MAADIRRVDKETIRQILDEQQKGRPSARQVVTKPQIVVGITLLVIVVVAGVKNFSDTLAFLIGFLIVAFFIGFAFSLIFRFLAAIAPAKEISKEDLDELMANPSELPWVTYLVALKDEAKLLPQILSQIRKQRYPESRKETIVLLEQNDYATIQVAFELQPFLLSNVTFLLLADEGDRTKPKALEIGRMARTRKDIGEDDIIVVFDAEDKPDPDQTLKAVWTFKHSSPDVVCVQAQLRFRVSGREPNWIERLNEISYDDFFGGLLAGFSSARTLILLGGTSNYFRARWLDLIGGWDPANTTEDADLGVRISRNGFKTAEINSFTIEKPTGTFYTALKQRTRWIKGYMQTYLVHMRNPFSLYRDLGFTNFVSFQVQLGIAPLLLLAAPIFWIMTPIYFLTRWEGIELMYQGWVYYLSLICFIGGNCLYFYSQLIAATRGKTYKNALLSEIPTLLSMFLMSAAAWRALGQLLRKNISWEKTRHDLEPEVTHEEIHTGASERVSTGIYSMPE